MEKLIHINTIKNKRWGKLKVSHPDSQEGSILCNAIYLFAPIYYLF
jgi:hypothetical protein